MGRNCKNQSLTCWLPFTFRNPEENVTILEDVLNVVANVYINQQNPAKRRVEAIPLLKEGFTLKTVTSNWNIIQKNAICRRLFKAAHPSDCKKLAWLLIIITVF